MAVCRRVEEGLVQKESPFCGTKTFGMCFVDNEGRVASVGTVLEIQEFAHIQVRRFCLQSVWTRGLRGGGVERRAGPAW